MGARTCCNCGRKIGKLERIYTCNGKPVCGPCDAILKGGREAQKEVRLLKVRPSTIRQHPIIVATLLILPAFNYFFFAFYAVFIFMVLSKLESHLTVTSHRVMVRLGILSKYTNEIQYNKIQNVHVSQSFLHRLLNVGRIRIVTAGDGGDIVFFGPGPGRIAKVIRSHQ